MRALSLWARSRSMIDRDAQIRVTDHSKMSFLIDKCMAKFPKSIETLHTIKAVTTDRQSARYSMLLQPKKWAAERALELWSVQRTGHYFHRLGLSLNRSCCRQ